MRKRCFKKEYLSANLILCFAIFLFSINQSYGQKLKPKWVNDFKGNFGVSQTTAVTTDQQDNIYITGYFFGTVDFDPSSGVKNLTSNGTQDVFIAKYKQDGTLIWAESIGGAGAESTNAMAVDKDFNVTIAGFYGSTTFDADPGPSAYNLNTLSNNTSGFIIHLDGNGAFLWAHELANNTLNDGSVGDYLAVASDSQDNVITTCVAPASSTVGDTTFTQPAKLMIKYDANGKVTWYLTIQNPTKQDVGHSALVSVAVDHNDNIILSGLFDGTVNFDPLGTGKNITTPDHFSYYIGKYSSSGALIWVNPIYSPNATSESVYPVVTTDRQNNINFFTIFYPSIIFGSMTINQIGNNGSNGCIAKYSPSGILQFAKAVGWPANSGFSGISNQEMITNDQYGNIYLTGSMFGSVNFDPTGASSGNLTAHGQQDFYLAKYDTSGNYRTAFSAGSANCNSTNGNNLAIDNYGNISLVGSFCSTINFDGSGCSSDILTSSAPADPFLVQYASASIENNNITSPATDSICTAGSPGTINGSVPTGGNGVYSYQWLSSPDSLNFKDITVATVQNYTPSVISNTTFYERIVRSDTCTASSVSNIVGIHVFPVLSAPVVSITAVNPTSIVFAWTVVPNAKGYEVSTDDGQTYKTTSSTTDTITNLQPGHQVIIIVEAIGTTSCQTSAASTPLTANKPSEDLIYVANAFTPNGDGRNDVLHVKGENILSLKFSVFDQWGEQIFSSTNTNQGWDGTYKGSKEPAGNYVYIVEAIMNDGQIIKRKGTVLLIK